MWTLHETMNLDETVNPDLHRKNKGVACLCSRRPFFASMALRAALAQCRNGRSMQGGTLAATSASAGHATAPQAASRAGATSTPSLMPRPQAMPTAGSSFATPTPASSGGGGEFRAAVKAVRDGTPAAVGQDDPRRLNQRVKIEEGAKPVSVRPARSENVPSIFAVSVRPSPAAAQSKAPAEPPLPEPASITEEDAASRDAAAKKLLACFPTGTLKAAGAGTSRVPAGAVRDPAGILIDRLANLGGKTGPKCDQLRLFLGEWAEFRALVNMPGEVFPIVAVDAEMMMKWLLGELPDLPIDAKRAGSAARIKPALDFASQLGLDVEVDDSTLARRVTRVKRRGASSSARSVPPPCFLARLVSSAATGILSDGSTAGAPLLHYLRVTVCQMMHAARGKGVIGSYFVPPDASDRTRPTGVLHLVELEDKQLRQEVDHYAPAISPVDGTDIGWMPELGASLEGCKFMCPDFVLPPGMPKDMRDVRSATGFVRKQAASLKYCGKVKAADQFTPALAAATGWSVEELKEAKLSGTHIWRKMGGTITELLLWDETDAVLVGEWSDPDASNGRIKRSAAASTRKLSYVVPEVQQETQIIVRSRYLQALSTAFETYGLDKVTDSTTWRDLFPEHPDGALQTFYGPRAAAIIAPKTKPAVAAPKKPAAKRGGKKTAPAKRPAPPNPRASKKPRV